MKPLLVVIITATAIAYGCSTTEQQSDSRLTASFKEVDFVIPQSVTINVEHAKRKWSFHDSDFKSDAQSPDFWKTPEIKVGATGTIKFHFFVTVRDGMVAVEGTVSVACQPNWKWAFEVIPSSDDLEKQCNDCDGVQGFKMIVPPENFDTVYVIWRGHAI